MGRWAQAKRRGGGIRAPTLPAPFPPSLIEFGESNLASQDENNLQTGGFMELWWADEPGVPLTLYSSVVWAWEVDWGDRGDLPAKFLGARVVGDGIVTEGYSSFSEWYDNTGA